MQKKNAERDLVLDKPGSVFHDVLVHPSFNGDIPVADPRTSPLLAPDLFGLPPLLLGVGNYDELRDDGMRFGYKAGCFNVLTSSNCYPVLPHDFAHILPDLKESVEVFGQIENFVSILDQR